MKCWYCEKETMEEAPDLGVRNWRCSECGATKTELNQPSGFSLATELIREGTRLRKYKASPVRRKRAKK